METKGGQEVPLSDRREELPGLRESFALAKAGENDIWLFQYQTVITVAADRKYSLFWFDFPGTKTLNFVDVPQLSILDNEVQFSIIAKGSKYFIDMFDLIYRQFFQLQCLGRCSIGI